MLGNFLVLRRMSMMADAISHAVLPGLAIAFYVTHSRDSLWMFLGAAIVGVLTGAFTEIVHRLGHVEESAAMGVVFTTLFALGLVLIERTARDVDLDPGCVLYGNISLIPLDTISLFGWMVPRAAVSLSAILLVNAGFVALLYKELRLSAFDPALSNTLGFPSALLHYVLMALVAVTTVACFESVGSILVIAMFIVPAAAAYLLTDRLAVMVLLSLLIAVVAAFVGHVAAIGLPPLVGFEDTETSGMIAVILGALFLAAMLGGPRQGLITRMFHRAALQLRIAREDIIGILYRLEETGRIADRAALREALAFVGHGGLLRLLGLRMVFREALAVEKQEGLLLTPKGRQEASAVIRSHRLWEAFLNRHFDLPIDHLHQSAEKTEHYLGPAMREAIAEELPDAGADPHGRPIPGAAGSAERG